MYWGNTLVRDCAKRVYHAAGITQPKYAFSNLSYVQKKELSYSYCVTHDRLVSYGNFSRQIRIKQPEIGYQLVGVAIARVPLSLRC